MSASPCARRSATHRPERFLNAHWLNPAYVIPVVELSTHAGTDPTVLARTKALMESIGELPVVCAPTPGYIVPRLQALIMNEAVEGTGGGGHRLEAFDKRSRSCRYALHAPGRW